MDLGDNGGIQEMLFVLAKNMELCNSAMASICLTTHTF